MCKLKADRDAKAKLITGTWPNGQTMTGKAYPDKAVPVSRLGQHKTRDEAVRALVLEYMPELADSAIEHINRVSKEFLQGSLKTHKIVNDKGL